VIAPISKFEECTHTDRQRNEPIKIPLDIVDSLYVKAKIINAKNKMGVNISGEI
jgi:hypothetical protein